MVEFFKQPPSHTYSQARRHQRYPAQFPVLVKSSEYRLHDEVSDLSEGGVGVVTRHPMPTMTLVTLVLELPTSDKPIEVVGRVMWSKPGAMGVRFEQRDPRLFDAVDRFAKDLQQI